MNFEEAIDLSGSQPVVIENDRINSTDYEKWLEEGEELKKRDSQSAWEWGEWWNSGAAYGERAKKVRSDEWEGPSYSTITNRASVCSEIKVSRRKTLEKGGVALASMSKGDDGLPVDNALLCWAEAEGLDEKITRSTDWGNPFVIGEDGDRETVISKYSKYLEMKDGLLHRLKSGELSGKLLVCWCCPDGCHGDILMKKTKEANK